MEVKKLITELLDSPMDEEVLIRTKDGVKKIRAIVKIESDTRPRYYTEIMLED